MNAAQIVTFVIRAVMVCLFLPFSALDKVMGFDHALIQAQRVFKPRPLAILVLLAGLAIEVGCSAGVVSGVADRACALVLAIYCAATALLFKRFWTQADLWTDPDGQGRNLLWDFLKNFALGAGFLLLVVGTDGSGMTRFLEHPLATSQPYGVRP